MDLTLFEKDHTLEIEAYTKHVIGVYNHSISIEPMATPRPRSTVMKAKATGKQFVHVYHPKEYTDYKIQIKWLVKDAKLGLKPGNYGSLFATFFMPYPASTPKKLLIEGAPHRKKPDWDNLIKGFQDALCDAGIVLSDGALSDGAIKKRYTIEPTGRIEFTLL